MGGCVQAWAFLNLMPFGLQAFLHKMWPWLSKQRDRKVFIEEKKTARSHQRVQWGTEKDFVEMNTQASSQRRRLSQSYTTKDIKMALVLSGQWIEWITNEGNAGTAVERASAARNAIAALPGYQETCLVSRTWFGRKRSTLFRERSPFPSASSFLGKNEDRVPPLGQFFHLCSSDRQAWKGGLHWQASPPRFECGVSWLLNMYVCVCVCV